MTRLVHDHHNQTVTDTETGAVIPVERFDEYAHAEFDAALKRLADAWIVARHRFQTPEVAMK